VVEDDSDVVDGDMLLASDSACSFHVTSNKGWFETYRPVKILV
jgi:hypothetical protein